MQISVMLQEIAGQHDRENPLQRAAPTGVAAYAINGSTLHSLLQLPVTYLVVAPQRTSRKKKNKPLSIN
jgi:hypothetical protein